MSAGVELAGRVALVTGSTRGIGRAIAERFAAEGATVVVNGRRQDDADRAAAEIPGAELAVGCDVADPVAVAAMVDATVGTLGRLDIVVNNAAVALDHYLTRVPDEEWQRTLDVNLSGPFYVTRAATPVMKKQEGGVIVNVISYAGLRGREGQVPYSASKAGLIGLTLASAKELARFGIRVNALGPAAMTDMGAQVAPEAIAEALELIPMGRIGTLEETAEAALFLASDRSRYTTGQILNADGGIHLR